MSLDMQAVQDHFAKQEYDKVIQMVNGDNQAILDIIQNTTLNVRQRLNFLRALPDLDQKKEVYALIPPEQKILAGAFQKDILEQESKLPLVIPPVANSDVVTAPAPISPIIPDNNIVWEIRGDFPGLGDAFDEYNRYYNDLTTIKGFILPVLALPQDKQFLNKLAQIHQSNPLTDGKPNIQAYRAYVTYLQQKLELQEKLNPELLVLHRAHGTLQSFYTETTDQVDLLLGEIADISARDNADMQELLDELDALNLPVFPTQEMQDLLGKYPQVAGETLGDIKIGFRKTEIDSDGTSREVTEFLPLADLLTKVEQVKQERDQAKQDVIGKKDYLECTKELADIQTDALNISDTPLPNMDRLKTYIQHPEDSYDTFIQNLEQQEKAEFEGNKKAGKRLKRGGSQFVFDDPMANIDQDKFDDYLSDTMELVDRLHRLENRVRESQLSVDKKTTLMKDVNKEQQTLSSKVDQYVPLFTHFCIDELEEEKGSEVEDRIRTITISSKKTKDMQLQITNAIEAALINLSESASARNTSFVENIFHIIAYMYNFTDTDLRKKYSDFIKKLLVNKGYQVKDFDKLLRDYYRENPDDLGVYITPPKESTTDLVEVSNAFDEADIQMFLATKQANDLSLAQFLASEVQNHKRQFDPYTLFGLAVRTMSDAQEERMPFAADDVALLYRYMNALAFQTSRNSKKQINGPVKYDFPEEYAMELLDCELTIPYSNRRLIDNEGSARAFKSAQVLIPHPSAYDHDEKKANSEGKLINPETYAELIEFGAELLTDPKALHTKIFGSNIEKHDDVYGSNVAQKNYSNFLAYKSKYPGLTVAGYAAMTLMNDTEVAFLGAGHFPEDVVNAIYQAVYEAQNPQYFETKIHTIYSSKGVIDKLTALTPNMQTQRAKENSEKIEYASMVFWKYILLKGYLAQIFENVGESLPNGSGPEDKEQETLSKILGSKLNRNFLRGVYHSFEPLAYALKEKNIHLLEDYQDIMTPYVKKPIFGVQFGREVKTPEI